MKDLRCRLDHHVWSEWAKVDCHLEKMCGRCGEKKAKYPPAEYILVKGLLGILEKAVDHYFDRRKEI